MKQDMRNILLAISLIMGFVFVVSFTAYYVKEKHSVASSCSCQISLPIILIALSSLGVFVGTLTYYFLSKNMLKERKSTLAGLKKTLDFLEPEEKKVLIEVIKNKGEISQARLVENTGLDKVKVFRIISKLCGKEILAKEKSGMGNKVLLNAELKNIYEEI